MEVNKVQFDGRVLLDLTTDTVAPENLARGATAHAATGERIVGEMRTVDDLLENVVVSDTLLWDGNTTGKTVFDMMGDGTYTYYPVSTNVLSMDDLANGIILESSDLNGNAYEAIKVTDFAMMSNKIIASRTISSVLFVIEDNAPLYNGTIPKRGIYFLHSSEYGYVSRITIPGYEDFSAEVEVIREKYIPDSVVHEDELQDALAEHATITTIGYGTCSTAAATAAKVITVSGDTTWKLQIGSRITVKFSYTNSAANPTFNVNNTGAKRVWYNTALIGTSNKGYAGTANRPMDFVYDGTQYVFIGWSVDSNTTYSNASLGQGYATCSTAEATTAKVGTLSSYSLTTGGIVAVKFTYAVPASATLNVNSKGAKAIYYKGAAITAGVIKAGDVAVFIYNGSQYHLIGIDSNMELATVATSGSYTDLTNKPTIPTKTSQLTNDSGFITGINVDSVLSTTSDRPVENKAVTLALSGKMDTFPTPTVNTDKKLTETGYYYVYVEYNGMPYHAGVIYFEYYPGIKIYPCGIGYLKASPTGLTFWCPPTNPSGLPSAWTTSDVSSSTTFYTCKVS